MSDMVRPQLPSVLPVPRQWQRRTGVCFVGPESPIRAQVDDRRVEMALRAWQRRLAKPGGAGVQAHQAPIRVADDPGRGAHREEYRLTVSPGGIEAVGASPAGCFCALQTLSQLSRFEKGEVPCCVIVDWPDFTVRGLLHDVTRGKVPTLKTLKLIVDRLAALKINQFQLNFEHAFGFSFDPTICGPQEGLTPAEVQDLDRYCQERFIDLVPALATFGHMGRILSMPAYRHLAGLYVQLHLLCRQPQLGPAESQAMARAQSGKRGRRDTGAGREIQR